MNIFRFLLTAALLIAVALPSLSAQTFKTAVGVRVDNGVNLTVKQHLADKWTLEGILHAPIGAEDVGVTLLAEKYQKILFRGLNLYAGAGAHYYWQNDHCRRDGQITDNVAGLSLIGGAELSIGRLNVSVDLKPELHLIGESAYPFEWPGASVSVRYILAKRERPQPRWKFWKKKEEEDGRKRRRR